MSSKIKVALAGAGAFGIKHLDGIRNIADVEVISLISRDLDKTRETADKYGIGHVTTELADSLALPGLDAVILCTPTQMHASQTLACSIIRASAVPAVCPAISNGSRFPVAQRSTPTRSRAAPRIRSLPTRCPSTWR